MIIIIIEYGCNTAIVLVKVVLSISINICIIFY